MQASVHGDPMIHDCLPQQQAHRAVTPPQKHTHVLLIICIFSQSVNHQLQKERLIYSMWYLCKLIGERRVHPPTPHPPPLPPHSHMEPQPTELLILLIQASFRRHVASQSTCRCVWSICSVIAQLSGVGDTAISKMDRTVEEKFIQTTDTHGPFTLHVQFSLNTVRHCMHSFGVVGSVLRLMRVDKHSITELYLTQLYVFLNVHPAQKI